MVAVTLGVVAAGFMIGMFVGGVVWLITAPELPDGGSGDGRDSQMWAVLGGVIGAVVACVIALLLGYRYRRAHS